MGIRQEYRKRNPGGFWFSPRTMKFFRSKVEADLGPRKDGRWLFVTSEEPPHGPRVANVRVMDTDGEISTAGPHMSLTLAVARRVARDLFRSGTAKLGRERVEL